MSGTHVACYMLPALPTPMTRTETCRMHFVVGDSLLFSALQIVGFVISVFFILRESSAYSWSLPSCFSTLLSFGCSRCSFVFTLFFVLVVYFVSSLHFLCAFSSFHVRHVFLNWYKSRNGMEICANGKYCVRKCHNTDALLVCVSEWVRMRVYMGP